MNACTLYKHVETDFDLDHCRDDWSRMPFTNHYTDSFAQRYMGLMLDNTAEVRQVFTAVFPSARLIDGLLRMDARDCLLVLHHPMHWDIRNTPGPFTPIDGPRLTALHDHRISLYVMHTPLDRSGPYSTTNTLAAALEIEKAADFVEYFGWPCGLIGTTTCRTTGQLARTAGAVVSHRARIWPYGTDLIEGSKVAVVAGGGTDAEVLAEVAAAGINTFVTGITACNEHSQAAHDLARKHEINLIGLTHYSSEKFACMALCDYFARVGLSCAFLPDVPVLEDMG
jgi:putative NIF3 family GTP cyclohydrolase 1 type 2